MVQLETLEEMLIKIAQRFKRIRRSKGISQEMLSKMSNVSYGSIKRFERTGEISLLSLAQLCQALDIRDEIDKKHIVLRWSLYFALALAIFYFGAYGPNYQPVDPIYGKF